MGLWEKGRQKQIATRRTHTQNPFLREITQGENFEEQGQQQTDLGNTLRS